MTRRAGRVGIERCESPLEEKLAYAFSTLSRFEWRQPDDDPWEVGRWPGWFLALLAQPEYGPYRADFGISSWVHEDDESPPFIVIIEVDGHDYHERTKEQAERDKSRDRFMTATEARVFRFTGREVWRDAEACAAEVLEYVIRIQQKHLEDEFRKFIIKKLETEDN
jgi:very-short-patch-repair endonuclease